MASRFDGMNDDIRKILDRAARSFPLHCSLVPHDMTDTFPDLSDTKPSIRVPYVIGLCNFLIKEGYLRDETTGGPRMSLVALTAKGMSLYGWSESDLKEEK